MANWWVSGCCNSYSVNSSAAMAGNAASIKNAMIRKCITAKECTTKNHPSFFPGSDRSGGWYDLSSLAFSVSLCLRDRFWISLVRVHPRKSAVSLVFSEIMLDHGRFLRVSAVRFCFSEDGDPTLAQSCVSGPEILDRTGLHRAWVQR